MIRRVCMDCTERAPGCHDECVKYAEEVKARQAERMQRYRNNQLFAYKTSVINRRIEK